MQSRAGRRRETFCYEPPDPSNVQLVDGEHPSHLVRTSPSTRAAERFQRRHQLIRGTRELESVRHQRLQEALHSRPVANAGEHRQSDHQVVGDARRDRELAEAIEVERAAQEGDVSARQKCFVVRTRQIRRGSQRGANLLGKREHVLPGVADLDVGEVPPQVVPRRAKNREPFRVGLPTMSRRNGVVPFGSRAASVLSCPIGTTRTSPAPNFFISLAMLSLIASLALAPSRGGESPACAGGRVRRGDRCP
jgi:hypothetical protein